MDTTTSKEEKNQTALNRYNAKWANTWNAKTSRLYREATKGKTSHYGVMLQNTVLALLGYEGLTSLKRLSPKAQTFVNWMTDTYPFEVVAKEIIKAKIDVTKLDIMEALGRQETVFFLYGILESKKEHGVKTIGLDSMERWLLEALQQ